MTVAEGLKCLGESCNSKSAKDLNGKWIEIPLIKNPFGMLPALLLNEIGLGEGLPIGGGSDTGMWDWLKSIFLMHVS